jgi:multidrug resistance efflux pump
MALTQKSTANDTSFGNVFTCTGAHGGQSFGNRSTEHLLNELLASQCKRTKAEAAALLRAGEKGQPEILAAHPLPDNNGSSLSWITKAVKPFHKVLDSGKSVLLRDVQSSGDNNDSQRFLSVIPIGKPDAVRAAAAFRLCVKNRQELILRLARLESTGLLLDSSELRLTADLQSAAAQRLQTILALLDKINRPKQFLAAAMALCNEVAAWLDCIRVTLGVLDDSCLHAKAMSHTDTFSRQMQMVQAIEAAMEECCDQDVEIVYPPSDAVIVSSRATASLSEHHGSAAVLSVPIRQQGAVVAVITLERSLEKPFTDIGEIEGIRLICDLFAPRLVDLHNHDRWFGARLASGAKNQMSRLLGPEHTGLKITALLIFLLVMFLAMAKCQYHIHTAFTLKAKHQQVIVAPFDTFSKTVLVEPGDQVQGGQTVLGTLETAELRLKLAALLAEELGYRKQKAAAMRDGNTAEAHIAAAQIRKVAAQIELTQTKIDQAVLVAPIDGWIISKDRKQQIGAPLEVGEILFEIANIDSLRAELHVPETEISRVAKGQSGEMAAVGHPDQKIRFVVDRINPLAEVVENQNVFRVRAELLEPQKWMRPGMRGEARILAGKKTYLWIASHRLVNWLRMKLWI